MQKKKLYTCRNSSVSGSDRELGKVGVDIEYCINWSGRGLILYSHIIIICLGSVSSVGRACACRAGGCGFDSRGRTNTKGLKITEK